MMLAGVRLIREISIGDRVRSSDVDIDKLAASIEEVGLLSAITIDADNNLVSGWRRIRACLALGLREVRVYVVDDLESATLTLALETNEMRIPMTTVDMVAIVGRLMSLDGEAARQRTADKQQRGWQTKRQLAAAGSRGQVETWSLHADGTRKTWAERAPTEPRTTIGKVLGMTAATAARYMAVASRLTSGDPILRDAAQQAMRDLADGRAIHPTTDQMYKTIRDRKAGRPEEVEEEKSKIDRRQQRVSEIALTKFQVRYLEDINSKAVILGGTADYFVEKVDRLNDDTPGEMRQAWVKQLEATRRSVSRLLRVLKEEREQ